MSKRRRKRINPEPFQATITRLSHDGRGIAQIAGKTTFIRGALPGETVSARYTHQTGTYNSAQALEVIATPSPLRTNPKCAHFGVCGGCALQHMQPDAQITHKQTILLEHFQHFGELKPIEILPPLSGPIWHYRHKARLGVRYVKAKDTVLVGFREAASHYLAVLNNCAVLAKPASELIQPLRDLIYRMDAREHIPQIEVALTEEKNAFIFRHLIDLSENDLNLLIAFALQHDIYLYLQPKGPESVHLLCPEKTDSELLTYTLPAYELTLQFHPLDFTQINPVINQAMIHQTLRLLELQPNDHVLDLFCGIGNFTLPLAKYAQHVIGIEGSSTAIKRAKMNATENQLRNIDFHVADLHENFPNSVSSEPWFKQKFAKLLLDPPRSGALAVAQCIKQWEPERIVYVACEPTTLARDAKEFVQHGYTLQSAGVLDMFPHTRHVESMALFVRN